jgi:hypothetical protein
LFIQNAWFVEDYVLAQWCPTKLSVSPQGLTFATLKSSVAACGEWRKGVNFTNVLRGAFAPTVLRQ